MYNVNNFDWIYIKKVLILIMKTNKRRSVMIKAGINGMGRIGRNLLRTIEEKYSERIQIVAVNDLVSTYDLAISLSRDSTYGRFPGQVSAGNENTLLVNDKEIRVFNQRQAEDIPWKDAGAQVIFEATGLYLTSEKAGGHIAAGAKHVVLSAPPKDDTPIFVIGTNDGELTGKEQIISNASCTTNALAPITKALDDRFGIESGLMSTTHAVTNGQRVVDNFRNERARSAFNNIIPTSTGAALAIGKVLKHLEGKLNGSSLRVPVSTGSAVEAVFLVKGRRSKEDVIVALQESALEQNDRSPLGKVLYVGSDYQVSADSIGSSWSSMVLAENTMVVPSGENSLIKITSFYDNEMGYAHRLAEMGILLGSKG